MSPPPRPTALPGRSLTWAAVALVLAGLLWPWAPWGGSEARVGDPSGPWAWLPMLAFGAACGLAGLLWGRQHAERQLSEQRQALQRTEQLIDAWYWETDPSHHLTLWRPPPEAPSADWAETLPAGLTLGQRFRLDHPGALEARLDSHAALLDVRVMRQDGEHPEPWSLRAVPRYGADGCFAGYLGCARPLSQLEQRAFDQAALASLLPGLGVAALVLREGAQGWAVEALSDEAAKLLQLEPAAARGRDWPSVRQALPAPLADAAAQLDPGASCAAGDWTLDVHGFEHGQVMLLRGAARATEATVSAAEHESFTYSVSHDLRAPIRVVDGFARILKEDYGRFLDRIGNDHLDRVLAAAARMNAMIDALLALSRLQSQPLQRRPVDLSQLVTYILDDLKREHPERVTELQIESGIVVDGDPTLLRIAMDNLIGNAWKYSSQAPTTHIEFRRESRDGQAVYVVADRGAGFDMRFADRLFGVFQRLHSPKDFQGTGVGLASVKRILRRHGGDIWAESEVGQGARFYFTIGG
ncbi:hypothetical protein KAK07_11965 [Ideonella sp. 4Y16]|uniref:histidine kinase n=1 Tax=Ideonella alba TaxID=2824118 RepID=A0A940YPF7_9BURK|nr:ATP-binding protein [Ideonella alba]MBQ0933449.1 hypothetical protein [Ideonella alba]MBQ0944051.1 hypothetical protein [Ideonella alba]